MKDLAGVESLPLLLLFRKRQRERDREREREKDRDKDIIALKLQCIGAKLRWVMHNAHGEVEHQSNELFCLQCHLICINWLNIYPDGMYIFSMIIIKNYIHKNYFPIEYNK